MKRIYSLLAVLLSGGAAVAQPIPLFQNFGTITNAIVIDALAFENLGTFNLSSALPYDMQNVVNFTNQGVMESFGGFRFDTTTAEGRQPAATFINSGLVRSDTFTGFNFFGGVFSFSQAAYIFINATNIDSSNGTLEIGTPGLMKLTGKNTDLTRSALIAGDPFSGGGGGGFNGYIRIDGTNYYTSPADITDLYGGAGTQTNNVDFQFIPPDEVSSPNHRVFFPGGSTNGSIVSVPQSFDAQFEAFANESTTADGDKLIQVAFVNTNFIDTNISAAVTFGFYPFSSNPNIVDDFAPAIMVDINSSSYDSITGGINTNTVTFVDLSAQQTNLVLFTNLTTRSRVRPSSYEISTGGFFSGFGDEGNTPYVPELLYDPSIHSSNVIAGFYGGYAAQVGTDPTSTVLEDINPTNQSPRIEINSDNLDLTLTRIRSEGPVIINTKHLVGNEGSDISAGLFLADIGSTNGLLKIANLFPSNFQRLRGEVRAYTFIWENTETDPDTGETNNVRFHVLILDQEFQANIVPSVESITLRAPNLIIEDDLKLDRTVRFVSQNVTFNADVTVANFDLRSTNFVGLRNFTNEAGAVFSGTDSLSLGFDTSGLNSIVNKGEIRAVGPLFKSDRFFNSGTIESENQGFFGLNGGPVIIQARLAEISSTNAPARVQADHDIRITAQNLVVTNSSLRAGINTYVATNFVLVTNLVFDEDLGMEVEVIDFEEVAVEEDEFLKGKLILDVTSSLSDSTFALGAPIHNLWQVTDGFTLERKPTTGDLYGTQIETIATTNSFSEIRHKWAGVDRGASPAGYLNNVTLGRLVITLESASAQMYFFGAGNANALYVDHLEINNPNGFDLTQSLRIDSNLKIYFRTSNQADILAQLFPTRFVQYTGALPAATASRLVVNANGLGIVSPNLNGKQLNVGKTYSVTAKPARGHVFTGWSDTESANSKRSFVMEPNLVLEANFAPNPFNEVLGTYNGLFQETNSVRQHGKSGSITFKTTPKGLFTGKLIIGKAHPFRGKLDASGSAEISVKRPKQSPLLLRLQLDMNGGTDEVTGTVVSDSEGWTATISGDRANAGVEVPAGTYSFVIAENPAEGIPQGQSVGTVTVDAGGNLRLKATLADGVRINQKSSVSKNGQWPLYLPLYRGAGSLYSWVTFSENGEATGLSGNVSWIKTPVSGPRPSNGFTNQTTVSGSGN